MELERTMFSKISKVKERQMLYEFTHMWNLRNKAKGKEKKRQTKAQTCKYREQKVTRGEMGRGMGERGEGDFEYTYLDKP